MKHNSTSSLGALHPILFFMVIYGISLFLALFVCRTIYYGINESSNAQVQVTDHLAEPGFTAVVAYK